jgi:hypothetical protein
MLFVVKLVIKIIKPPSRGLPLLAFPDSVGIKNGETDR